MPRFPRLRPKSIAHCTMAVGLLWGLVMFYSGKQLGKESRSEDRQDGRFKLLHLSLQRRTLDVKRRSQEVGGRNFGGTKEEGRQSHLVGTLGTPDNRLSTEERLRVEGYERHAFNKLISEKIGLQRDIPDTRHNLCQTVSYPDDLPSASIIICFHNEAPSALLRTVQSVIDRSPHHLIHEIILVDDFSDRSEESQLVTQYVRTHPNVKIIQTERREGLIRGRTIGARFASGDVLVFLDSHCEVNREWLEPLLERIKERHSQAVCPIIDIINSDTFKYVPSAVVRGGFNWGLQFNWEQVPNLQFQAPGDVIKPIKSPTMAGGLFAINRTFFHDIGEYDQGMEIWGGENLELSFRLWMCGGGLEIVPCSRVGHVFRKRRPYDDPNTFNSVYRNQIRLAEVWLDDYKQFFYRSHSAYRRTDPGDLTQRLELKKRLKCKTFQWYLRNVYPEQHIPERQAKAPNQQTAGAERAQGMFDNEKIVKVGQVLNEKFNACLDIAGKTNVKRAAVALHPCSGTEDQIWAYSVENELRMGLLCLDATNNVLRMMRCLRRGEGQDWTYQRNTRTLYNELSKSCLSWDAEEMLLGLEDCAGVQKWSWREV